MQYDPKLKKVTAQIKELLIENDIAGLVVLHTPNFSEYLLHVDTSYSCARPEGTGSIRVRARLQEDFNGNQEQHTKKLTDTANMFQHLATTGGNIVMSVMRMAEHLNEHLNAEHRPGDSTSHNQQNN